MSSIILSPNVRAQQHRAAPRALIAVAVLLVAGTGILATTRLFDQGSAPSAAQTSAQPSGASADLPTALDVTATQPTEYLVIYARPAPDTRLDGTVYVRSVDGLTGVSAGDTELGKFTGVEIAPTNSPVASIDPRLIVHNTAGEGNVFRLTEAAPALTEAFQSGGLPRTVSVGDVFFHQEDGFVVGRDDAGRILAQYAVPEPLPIRAGDPITETLAVIVDDSGFVTAILPTADGHLLAMVENPSNSLIANLATGDRLDLPGFTPVQAATVGEDGYVYAVGWSRLSAGNDLEVVKIDPTRLTVVARHPVGYRGLVNGRTFLATPDGQLFVYLPSLGGESLLYRVDAATAASTLVPLPPALGLDATVGVDGKIYLSGGPARNRVSIYDPTTGALEQDVPWLRAPEGTYVEGVVVR